MSTLSNKLSELINRKDTMMVLLLIGAFALLTSLFFNWSYDDPYITYRYALNLAAGKGLVYNPNERVLSTTSPLFALILSFIGFLGVISIPRAAILLGCLSLSISGYLLWLLGKNTSSSILGMTSFVLFGTFALPATTISSETPLYILVILLAIFFYHKKRLTIAFALAAILVFIRPDGILLSIIILAHLLFKNKKQLKVLTQKTYLIPVVVFIGINSVGWGAIWYYYGSPLPVTLFAKQQQGTMQISQQFLSGFLRLIGGYAKQPYMVLEAFLSIVGFVFLFRRKHSLLLLFFWVISYFISYSILRVSRYYWYYAPLVIGFMVLVGAGFQWLWNVSGQQGLNAKNGIRTLSIIAFLFCLISQITNLYNSSQHIDRRIPIYRQVGLWLKKNTALNAKVGVLEVGVIGFYSQRYMVDFAGLIQPDVAAQMSKNSTYEDTARYAINHYRPTYVILHQDLFPTLEKELRGKCILKKRFRGEDYESNYDLIVFNCIR